MMSESALHKFVILGGRGAPILPSVLKRCSFEQGFLQRQPDLLILSLPARLSQPWPQAGLSLTRSREDDTLRT